MKYAQFLAHCRQSVLQIDHQGEDYLNYHAARFYRTYQLCRGLLPSGGSLLSIGAGSAYVEAVLASELQARVVAVDFPGAIELNRRHYDANRFVSVAADLSLDDLELPIEPCDMVLSAEIVEHIPAPPSLHFRKLLPYLKPNGHFVVSTPNLGSIMHILSLLRMQPILDPPSRRLRQSVSKTRASTAANMCHASLSTPWPRAVWNTLAPISYGIIDSVTRAHDGCKLLYRVSGPP
jgi:2-polyprenyl-3-methyl-5-hydroxy-6-metoxy-1,4-benzoquinol methylase